MTAGREARQTRDTSRSPTRRSDHHSFLPSRRRTLARKLSPVITIRCAWCASWSNAAEASSGSETDPAIRRTPDSRR